MWRICQEYLQVRTLCRPVDLGFIRVGQHIGVKVPFLRVIGDVVEEPFEDGSAEAFHLSIYLRAVSCGEQVPGFEKATDVLEELRVELFAIV